MALNICTVENGARIHRWSSQSNSKHAPAENILREDRSLIWTSEDGMPQFFVIDIRNLKKRPKQIRWVGFDLWHDYDSNPKLVELQIRQEGIGEQEDYITWRSIQLDRKVGKQYFALDPIPQRFGFLKVLIKDTYGASKTYLNQIMLYESDPNTHHVESRVRTSTDNHNNKWRKDTRFSRNKESVHLSEQERSSIAARFRQPEVYAEGPNRNEALTDQHTEQTDERYEQQEEQLGYEQERMRDSLSGLARSQRNSQDLNALALLSHNLMGVEENMQTIYNKLEKMSLRLDHHQNSQRDMQQRLNSKLKKYVDDQLQKRLKAQPSQRSDGQLHRLIRQLMQKLQLRERKISKLKNSR